MSDLANTSVTETGAEVNPEPAPELVQAQDSAQVEPQAVGGEQDDPSYEDLAAQETGQPPKTPALSAYMQSLRASWGKGGTPLSAFTQAAETGQQELSGAARASGAELANLGVTLAGHVAHAVGDKQGLTDLEKQKKAFAAYYRSDELDGTSKFIGSTVRLAAAATLTYAGGVPLTSFGRAGAALSAAYDPTEKGWVDTLKEFTDKYPVEWGQRGALLPALIDLGAVHKDDSHGVAMLRKAVSDGILGKVIGLGVTHIAVPLLTAMAKRAETVAVLTKEGHLMTPAARATAERTIRAQEHIVKTIENGTYRAPGQEYAATRNPDGLSWSVEERAIPEFEKVGTPEWLARQTPEGKAKLQGAAMRDPVTGEVRSGVLHSDGVDQFRAEGVQGPLERGYVNGAGDFIPEAKALAGGADLPKLPKESALAPDQPAAIAASDAPGGVMKDFGTAEAGALNATLDRPFPPQTSAAEINAATDAQLAKSAARAQRGGDIKLDREGAESMANSMNRAARGQRLRDAGQTWTPENLDIHEAMVEVIRSAPTPEKAMEVLRAQDPFNLQTMGSFADFQTQMRALSAQFSDAFAKTHKVVPYKSTFEMVQSYAKYVGLGEWAGRMAALSNDAHRLSMSVEMALNASAVRQMGQRMSTIAADLRTAPHDVNLVEEIRRLGDVWYDASLYHATELSEWGRTGATIQRLNTKEAQDVVFKNDLRAGGDNRAVARKPGAKVLTPEERAKLTAPAPAVPEVPATPSQPSAAVQQARADKAFNREMAKEVIAQPITPEVHRRLFADMAPAELEGYARLFERSGGQITNIHATLKAIEAGKQKIAEAALERANLPWDQRAIANFHEGVLKVFISHLISGIKTMEAIATSGITMNAFDLAAQTLGGIASRNGALVEESAASMYAYAKYAGENVAGAGAAWSAQRSVLAGAPPIYAKSGVLGEIYKSPGVAAGTLDEYTKISAYRAIEFGKAVRQARSEGLGWHESIAQAEKDVEMSIQQGIAMNKVTLSKAGIPTLSEGFEEGTATSFFAKGLAEMPYSIGKMIVPFMRPSVNTFLYVGRNTPGLNLLSKQSRDIMAAEGEEAVLLRARSVMAGSMMLFTSSQFLQGNVTGEGPKDPVLRTMWLKDHQPYSWKIGGQWWSYRQMEPFASFIGLMADTNEAYAELDPDTGDSNSAFAAITTAMVKNMYNKQWTVGMSDILTAAGRGDADSFGRIAGNFAKGLIVPQFVQQFNQDPIYRETRGVVDKVLSGVPGWSETLPAKYDWDGHPTARQVGLWQATIARPKDATPSTVETELRKNDVRVSTMPSRLFKGQIDLLDPKWEVNGEKPYDVYQQFLRKENVRKQIETLFSSGEWDDLKPGSRTYRGGERQAAINEIIDEAQDTAIEAMLSEWDQHEIDAVTPSGAKIKSTLRMQYEAAKTELAQEARYGGPKAEDAIREETGVPLPTR